VGERRRPVSEDPVARFGWRLRDLRQASGMTLRQLESVAGYARSTLSAAESGSRLPSWDVTEAYVRGCGQRDLGRWRGWWEMLAETATPALATQAPPVPVPAQLPPDISLFVGRESELTCLDAMIGRTGVRADAPMPITVVAGTGGVGKTALAVRWAHRRRDRFPDGQLYVDLRGYDPALPVDAADALAGFLRALGVPGAGIPAGMDERTALFRSLTSARRLLVLLDNAVDIGQIRPILPGSATCAVIVTSRDSLASLVAVHGARRVEMDPLSGAEAVRLLERLLGSRIRDEQAAAATLVEQCAGLPLALRIAAEIAAQHPQAPLADVVAGLADRQRRLDLLDTGDDVRSAVRTVFSWSYRQLTPAAARAFRLAGLHPGPDFEAYTVAALTDEDPHDAGQVLGLLARAHLLHETRSGRYAMHDLLRAYAVGLVDAEERAQAADRLGSFYTAMATAATRRAYAQGPAPGDVPVTDPALPPLADAAAAQVWLDAERVALVAVATASTDHRAGELAKLLFPYFDNGFFSEAIVVHGHARQVARDRADRAGEAESGLNVGITHGRMGRHREALLALEQAYRLFDDVGDRHGRSRALANIGVMQGKTDDTSAAIRSLERSSADLLALGDARGAARTLINLAELEQQLGQHRSAAGRLRRALSLAREAGHRDSEAAALTTLGCVLAHLGDTATAARHHREALAVFRSLGNRYGEIYALNGLGEAADAAEAIGHHQAASRLAMEVDARDEYARANAGLERAYRKLGTGAG
jgi:tetratricopeptide (TPR) repeat protein/DNA-binding XRE family transcriptional regulator